MPKFALEVKFETENINRVELSDPSSFSWRLKIKCTHCGTENDKDIFLVENETYEQLTGRGTTHLNYKCKNCERKSQIDILPSTYSPWTAKAAEKNSGFVPMLQFDCRGIEVVAWDPFGHQQEGIVAVSGSEDEEGSSFEVDFSEGEWTDYDADNEQSIGIYSITSRTEKVK